MHKDKFGNHNGRDNEKQLMLKKKKKIVCFQNDLKSENN